MIEIGDRGIDIEGNDFTLGLEFSRICKVFADKNIMSKELMLHSVEAAFMSEEELHKSTIETLDKLKEVIGDVEAFIDLFRDILSDE